MSASLLLQRDNEGEVFMGNQEQAFSTTEQPTDHAFVVFGAYHTYIAHSAMFLMQPHAYQAIQELYLGTTGERNLIVSMREREPHTLILARSKINQVLFQLLRDSFQVNLFRNAIDDRNIFATVTAIPGRLLYYNPLNVHSPRYPDGLTYYMFGRGGEVFMSHVITRHMNFHHEVTLAELPAGVNADDLERGFQVTVLGIPDGFHTTDPLPNANYPVILPNGSQTYVRIYRRDRFTFNVLNGTG